MRILRKILVYSFLTLVILVAGLTISLFLFRDRIIQQFIREVNKQLATPVRVDKIDISAFEDFPRLAIVLHNVYVEDSHPGEYPLLTADRISFTIDPLELRKGQYIIRGLAIHHSETNLIVNRAGINNFTLVKKGEKSESVSFDLSSVLITEAVVNYRDIRGGQHHVFMTDRLEAGIRAEKQTYQITAAGDITTEQIGIGEELYFRGKTTTVDLQLIYDDAAQLVTLTNGKLTLEKSDFDVSGSYAFANTPVIDLSANARNTNIHTLLSLLPHQTAENFTPYQSEGDVYFNLALKGKITKTTDPALSVDFGLRNVSLTHPSSKTRISDANLTGSFKTPALGQLRDASLTLTDIHARLNDDPFEANLKINNFNDPFVDANFSGTVNAADLFNFYPIRELQDVAGRLEADISLRGRIGLLKSKETAQQVLTEGTIELQDISATWSPRKARLEHISGVLQFNNNDLAMTNLSGRLEKSDFVVNGFFKNVITWLLFENQPLGIEATFKSDFLDVDRLLALGYGANESNEYRFSISSQVHLNLHYQVGAMRYRRFNPRDVAGDLLVKNQMAVARTIRFRGMGGSVNLNAIIDARNPKAIDLVSSARLDGIHLDSLFLVFENFQQSFISHEHLRGTAVADISLETTLDPTLHIFPETLIADASAVIHNGELNNFQPMQKLNKYLDDEGLSRLRFADLRNDIHIEKKTIYIPPMQISSNVTTLQLSGTHTFDQRIDYRVIAPLRNKKKIDPDEAFGAIEEDTQGKSKVFLRITGTTDKFEVVYDKEAVRRKIGTDIKKEVQELKDAFKLKGKKKKKEVELEKDDYFDW